MSFLNSSGGEVDPWYTTAHEDAFPPAQQPVLSVNRPSREVLRHVPKATEGTTGHDEGSCGVQSALYLSTFRAGRAEC